MTNQEIIEARYDLAFQKYIISPDGTITNKRFKKRVEGSINRKGYRYVAIYDASTGKQGKVYVHRLVALRYIPNPDNKPHINHKDGNPLNNDRDNLEWCTAQENVVDGFGRGREVWNKGNISKERILFYANKYPKQIFWYLTKDDFAFAKALWDSDDVLITDPAYFHVSPSYYTEAWKYHLQQMVIAEDPIAYLGEHLI